MIPLFDLHCDTLTKMCANSFSFSSSPLNISKDKTKFFSPYIQVSAIWSDNSLSDKDAFLHYKEVVRYKKRQDMYFCSSVRKFRENTFILAVEDARILEDDISRLEKLKNDGVRFLTLVWKGVSCIGGAWNTNEGLTDFGKEVVLRSLELGIIPDVSHSSRKSTDDILSIAEKRDLPAVATHSDAYSVCKNDRNLTDYEFLRIKSLGGIVGISLAPEHLSATGKAEITDILNHIEHYLMLGGEDTVCLGCDFDGVPSLPDGINDVGDLKKLYSSVSDEFGRAAAEKIFFQNAYDFARKHLK